MSDYAGLAHYRRIVAGHYAAVRIHPNPPVAAQEWRAARNRLFKENPFSALEADQQANFSGLPYANYNPAWRFVVPIDFEVTPDVFSVELPEGTMKYERFGKVNFIAPTGEKAALALFWIQSYGGGVFLPFGDATNGTTTYGGGRYLYDTIKGADLGITHDLVVLDFNFAYHPSCVYNPRWVCPLTPAENRLPFAVPVGELSG